MKHTIGSVLQFTPAAPFGTVKLTFVDPKETEDIPLLGWAIVVRWNNFDETDNDTDAGEQETDIEPVFLIDGLPTTPTGLRLQTETPIIYEVKP